MLSSLQMSKSGLRMTDFDYDLPESLIARRPAKERDGSRLMLVDRKSGEIGHHHFRDLPALLSDTDLLVLNDTRVFPARLDARSGARRFEVLLLREISPNVWEALVKPGRRARISTRLEFDSTGLQAEVIGTTGSSIRLLGFGTTPDVRSRIGKIGRTPLPPYIQRERDEDVALDRERYQTIFARDNGSVAAPTAGLHFTAKLLRSIHHVFVTLHVGYGTFRPVSTEIIEEHRMDSEHYHLSRQTALQLQAQRAAGNRIVAVGSTSTRVLEHVLREEGALSESSGWTDLFIFPGFEFQVVNALITNFHLPRSSLILLVSAFAGRDLIQRAYRVAIEKNYRFYSYGDAMLIL